jgi:hypothetical protein
VPRPDGAARGKVKGFSNAARLRMLEWINSIDRASVRSIFFITLTATRGLLGWEGIEEARRRWEARFRRRWGADSCFIIWKKEPHASGSPHLHALIFWLKGAEVPRLKAEWRPWNDRAWAESVGQDVERITRVGCRSELMRSWNGIAWYSAKYLGKDVEGLREETGRIWGIINRKNLLACVRVVRQVLNPRVGQQVRRTLCKLQNRKRRYWQFQDVTSRQWFTIRPRKLLSDDAGVDLLNPAGSLPKRRPSFSEVEVRSVEEQVARYKRRGVRVRLVKRRSHRRAVVPIWADVEDTTMWGKTSQIEKISEEIHSFATSLHFVDAGQVLRLVRHYERLNGVDVPF